MTITGSGAEDRDERISIVEGYRPFWQVADTLARRESPRSGSMTGG